jgi:hypothetical protein
MFRHPLLTGLIYVASSDRIAWRGTQLSGARLPPPRPPLLIWRPSFAPSVPNNYHLNPTVIHLFSQQYTSNFRVPASFSSRSINSPLCPAFNTRRKLRLLSSRCPPLHQPSPFHEHCCSAPSRSSPLQLPALGTRATACTSSQPQCSAAPSTWRGGAPGRRTRT